MNPSPPTVLNVVIGSADDTQAPLALASDGVLRWVISQFTSQVAAKLRDQGSVAGAVHVFIATSPYRKADRQHAPSATLPLAQPSADTRVLISAAVRALRGVYRAEFNYLKAGVMLVDLQPQARHQGSLDLFEPDEPPDEVASAP